MSHTKAWAYVLVGGALELFWMSGLKYAHLWWQYGLTLLGIIFSFTCMIKSSKVLEVGVSYSVFVGLGTVGIVLAEIFYFKSEVQVLKIVLICVIFLSVVGLKYTSKLT